MPLPENKIKNHRGCLSFPFFFFCFCFFFFSYYLFINFFFNKVGCFYRVFLHEHLSSGKHSPTIPLLSAFASCNHMEGAELNARRTEQLQHTSPTVASRRCRGLRKEAKHSIPGATVVVCEDGRRKRGNHL